VRGRRVAVPGVGCDLACGRARLTAGQSAEPVFGGQLALERCAVLFGSALAGPKACGGVWLRWPEWLAGPALDVLVVSRGGHRVPSGLRPRERYARLARAQPRFHQVVTPRRTRDLLVAVARRRGPAGRTPCRPRCGTPSRGRGLRGPRWPAGRRSGRAAGSRSCARCTVRARNGSLRPGRAASIGRVWCYGDLDIGRVLPPPGGGNGGTTWDRSAGGTAVLGANRGSKAA
jgi:hypothetical protein